jgi:hypothetical protein
MTSGMPLGVAARSSSTSYDEAHTRPAGLPLLVVRHGRPHFSTGICLKHWCVWDPKGPKKNLGDNQAGGHTSAPGTGSGSGVLGVACWEWRAGSGDVCGAGVSPHERAGGSCIWLPAVSQKAALSSQLQH